MSGHSKWKTIKHKKALTDSKRSKIFSKVSRMISVAVRDKGPKPDQNNALRLAIEKAREVNMPGDNIQKIIAKYSGDSKEQLESIQFEGYGPNGTAFIIDTITDSRNRISQEIRHILASHGGSLAAPGSVLWMFDRFGVITVSLDGVAFSDLEENAIEAGAHDIVQEESKAIILTKPEDLYMVKTALEERGIKTEGAQLEYRAKNTVDVSDDNLKKKVESLYEELDDNEDVQELFDNISFSL